MEQKIIYREGGGVAVLTIPSETNLTAREVAEKWVPTGQPFKIVSVEDIPADRSARNAWTVDEADLTDGVGADLEPAPEDDTDGVAQ